MKRLLVVSVSALLLSACVTETTGVNRPEPKSASQRADIHTQLAANYLQRNQLEIALEEVEKALDADPRNQKANYIMALLQQRLRKPDQADSYFRKAIAGANPFPNAEHDYARFLCARGKYDDADKLFTAVLQNPLYRSHDLVFLNQAECYIEQERYAEAEQSLRAALKLNPRLQPALYYMAKVMYLSGQTLATRAWYQRYLEAGADTAEILYIAYDTETKLGDRQAATDFAQRLKAKYPRSEEAKKLISGR